MVAVVCDSEGKVLVVRPYRKGGSNNIAELMAVQQGLDWAKTHGYTAVEIKTDSKNNFAWALGKIGTRVNDREKVLTLRESIDKLRRAVALTLTWVPRKENLAGSGSKTTMRNQERR